MIRGGVAGCVAKTVTAPLTRITVLAQISSLERLAGEQVAVVGIAGRQEYARLGLCKALRNLALTEGIPALWRGNMITLAHRFPFAGVNFAVFEWSSKALPPALHRSYGWQVSDRPSWHFVPGALAGCVGTISCYPIEVLRTRLMVELKGERRKSYRRVEQHLLQLWQEGHHHLRGMGLALTVTVPAVSISFGVYTVLQDKALQLGLGRDRSPLAEGATTLVAGGLSGMAASLMTFPLDTLRRRAQAGSLDSSITADMSALWRERGFFRGLKPEMVKSFPTVALTYFTYELIR
jgi:hypothetical protein